MSHATELRQLTILTKYLPTTKAKNTTFTSKGQRKKQFFMQ